MKSRLGKHPQKRGKNAGFKPAARAINVVGPGCRQINPKWGWHYRTLIAARERLLGDRAERWIEASEPIEPHSMNMADSASDEFEHAVALAELSNEQQALYEIEEALKRIENGTYGYCQETGRAIPKARLRAIPWTRFRKEVEERLEKNGTITKAALGKLGSVRTTMSELEQAIEEAELPVSAEDESLRRDSYPVIKEQKREKTIAEGQSKVQKGKQPRKIA